MSAAAETQPVRLTIADRLVVALPLASVYLWLSIVYCVEAWKRVTPWLFTDELEYTQLSRAIAATGHAARRGEPHSFGSLYTVVTAPFWLIDDVAAAYSAIKYFDVLVMTSVLFPTYFLARLVVGRGPALFAAAAAAAIPSLAYSSWIAEETLAYPYSALCLFLIAKALLARSRGWVAGAVAASALAPVVRGELIVIPIAFAFGILFMWWSSEPARARRANWSVGDWLGCFAIVAGAIIVISGFATHHSTQWMMDTSYNWTKKRIFVYGDWAAGALAVGLGVVPLVLGLASLVRVRGEERTRELRVFRSVATAAVIGFGLYTGMKAAYLSQVFASRVEERNLIYISPVLFIGTALVLERRRVNLPALAGAAAYAIYVVVGTPLFVGNVLYSDALGLAILQQANRYYLLSDGTAQWILIGAALFAVASALVLTRARRTIGIPLAVLVGVLVLAWNVTAEVSAAAGNVSVSRELVPTLGRPFTWVDDATHLKPTLYLAQSVADQNPEWLLEFWNRSITGVSSLDGSVQGPGPAGAPNVTDRGKLYWGAAPSQLGKLFDYAVEEWPCIDFAGTFTARHFYRGGAAQPREWRLIRLTKPNRLRAMCSGIYGDGWSGEHDSTYFRFAGDRPGWLQIRMTRQSEGSPVDIRLGTITEQRKEPAFGRTLHHVRTTIPANRTVTEWVRTPPAPFAVHTVIAKKFSPGNGDVRQLGALVTYHWYPKKP